ncbi:acyl-CoA dehydrogenase family protein [Streptomyces tubercidicus]|uniref:acyl-CoA dehydrogenase family protein n=1 Tax=Streptomyces tubercidicus TaxID=47759 RepID=UPI002E1459EF|nr:acyl-CoA dehydrogenase family protein [Streptomyces tubercidicus]
MHLAPTARQERLRAELRSYFRELLPDGPVENPAEQRAVLRRIGADGMLGLGWPTAYGGQGRGPDEQFVFFDEAYRAGAPVSMVTLNTVGPTMMKYGTQQQKDYFLPRILTGELVFAIGYTEPEAGTDLAALRTSAVRRPGVVGGPEGGKAPGRAPEGGALQNCASEDRASEDRAPEGAHWLINGSISIILVPTDAPGFSWTPIETVGGLTTTATYYDGIRVPAGNLVGEENGGWQLITNQLNHERVALAAIGMQAEDAFDAALAYARTPDRETGERPADRPWVRSRLAEAHARLAATRLLNWRLVGDVGAGTLSPGDASGVKFAGTESTVEVYRLCQEVAGDAALVRAGSPGVFRDGELERMNRAAQINTFGGGVSEVQREIVATMRLGMRRGRR